MKRFLIELCEVLILCALFPAVVIVFGAIEWTDILFNTLDETEKEVKEKWIKDLWMCMILKDIVIECQNKLVNDILK